MKRLEGRVAIVTGCNSGIGAGVAHRLAREGARLVLADIDLAGIEGVAAAIRSAGGQALSVPLDLASEDSVRNLFALAVKTYGTVDVLHNNAADTRAEQMGQDMDFAHMSIETWDRAFDVNARGTMLMIKHALPIMQKARRGSIINTSSGAAVRGDVYNPAYAASKAAVNCMTLYVATQYGKQGIRCNAVMPGMIKTEKSLSVVPAGQFRRIESHTLTPYLGDPSDIAAAVAYLASDDARFVTGQVIAVDGGIASHMPYFAEVIDTFTETPGRKQED